MRFKKFEVLLLPLLFFSGIAVVLLVYWPGMSGTFIFDDFPNLGALGDNGGVSDRGTFIQYVLGGFSGPTGRPLSLLTFLLNANNWPAAPAPFKYTNILIHILNGVLLFWVTLKILFILEGRPRLSKSATIVALTTSLAWLLHPFLVSTVLYIVQRMAQLSLLFSLVGLLVWLKGRLLICERPITGYIWMGIGVVGGTILATFSKENGVLFPLLVWVVDSTVIRAAKIPVLNLWWRRVFFIIPAMLIVGYLFYRGFSNGWGVDYPARDFSPIERLLTQCRVLFFYLSNWFLPSLFTTGVFYDHFSISEGLFSPFTTFISMLGVVSLIGFMFHIRERFPVLSMSVLFFFVSNLVESTTVGLEIIFEHRVYLGSVFLFLPCFYYLWTNVSLRKSIFLSVLLILSLATFCWQRASLWGSYPAMVKIWAEKAPDSARAQVELASMYFKSGASNRSLAILDSAIERMPDDFLLRATHLLNQCKTGVVKSKDKEYVLDLASRSIYKPTWLKLTKNMLEFPKQNDCQGLEYKYVVNVMNNFLLNEKNSVRSSLAYSQLTYVKAVAQLFGGDGQSALVTFDESINNYDGYSKLMNIAANLASVGLYGEAKEYAEKARRKKIASGKSIGGGPQLTDIDAFIETLNEELMGHDES